MLVTRCFFHSQEVVVLSTITCTVTAFTTVDDSNFIINDSNASAADIESLINLVQATVKSETGILLQTEVKIIGDAK